MGFSKRSPARRHVLAAAAGAIMGAALLAAPPASAELDEPLIFAHAGQLSPKDDCHKHKAAGERHWHLAATDERGGECVKRDGVTVKVGAEAEVLKQRLAAAEAEAINARRQAEDLTRQRNGYAAEADRWERRALEAEARIDEAERAAMRAASLATTAQAEAEASRTIAEEAERRARGIGPRVDLRCRTAVEKIVHGDTGWLSSSVSVDEEERIALSRDCLAP